jgi:hypothetical protein
MSVLAVAVLDMVSVIVPAPVFVGVALWIRHALRLASSYRVGGMVYKALLWRHASLLSPAIFGSLSQLIYETAFNSSSWYSTGRERLYGSQAVGTTPRRPGRVRWRLAGALQAPG